MICSASLGEPRELVRLTPGPSWFASRPKFLRPNLATYYMVAVLLALVSTAEHGRGQDADTTVRAGARLRVEFDTAVGSAISRVNDGVEIHLLKPIVVAGRPVVPAGSVLSGRVLAARSGDKHRQTFPILRLGFDKLILPDGRAFSVATSLADLGALLKVDSEGTAMPKEANKGGDAAGVAGDAGVGAAVGGIAGGGKGAATGAAIGAGIGILGDLAAHSAQWQDFILKKGRKAWLRLDSDLELGTESPSPTPKGQDSSER